MIGKLKCGLGLHDFRTLRVCIIRAIILVAFTSRGGQDRVCRRCGHEDYDMLNCNHGHVLVAR